VAKIHEGDFDVLSRDDADRVWTVLFTVDNGPVPFYAYDRAAGKATFMFYSRPALKKYTLARMEPISFNARDGLTIHGYLSCPPGVPKKNLPMVLNVHGGPWYRDTWGYNPEAQWLANRGYACLQVNFRGSVGYGKAFINAGDKEWGGKMHDDLIDGVRWAIEQKVANPNKIAIAGGSYGGYATLVGLTFTPDVFACGVDIVGPSNLVTLINSVPPYWKPQLDVFYTRMGDPRTEAGEQFLLSRSPLTFADRIKRPLLIGQGANDPRVKQAESDQIVQAMKAKNIPVTYVLYPDEGHGFARPPNRLSFFAVMEQFLSRVLGGRAQPIGEDFKGSSITAPEGVEYLPGLKAALSGPR
jgi:dipeptidyl aminopeptidase/acylaminoacyl peptidase